MTADNSKLRSGGEILVDGLKTHKVNRIFCVPGESYLGYGLKALPAAAT